MNSAALWKAKAWTARRPLADEAGDGEPAEEPVANGDEDDIMSAMSLDAVAEAEHLNDDTINEDED